MGEGYRSTGGKISRRKQRKQAVDNARVGEAQVKQAEALAGRHYKLSMATPLPHADEPLHPCTENFALHGRPTPIEPEPQVLMCGSCTLASYPVYTRDTTTDSLYLYGGMGYRVVYSRPSIEWFQPNDYLASKPVDHSPYGSPSQYEVDRYNAALRRIQQVSNGEPIFGRNAEAVNLYVRAPDKCRLCGGSSEEFNLVFENSLWNDGVWAWVYRSRNQTILKDELGHELQISGEVKVERFAGKVISQAKVVLSVAGYRVMRPISDNAIVEYA